MAKTSPLGATWTRRAGHCNYATDTIRGKCWRLTHTAVERIRTIGKNAMIKETVFRCYQHWGKP